MIVREPTLRVIRKNDPDGYIEGSFEIVEPLIFTWRRKRCIVSVDVGTITNFASIPVGFRNVFNINGNHRLAAIVHDFLYGQGGVVHTKKILGVKDRAIPVIQPITVYYSRKEADDLFIDIMKHEGVGYLTACTMYAAVRLFGGFAWKGE